MSQFVKRKGNIREVSTPNVGVLPEVQPGQNIQGILNAVHNQGGGTVKLGPYTYKVVKTLVVPENVTLTGVPRISKLILKHEKGSTQYGPVIKLNTKSRLTDCYLDLVLASGHSFSANGSNIRDDDGVTTDTGDTTNNSVVALVGANARLERCFIPGKTSSAGVRRAVVVEANNCFVINNEIEYPDNAYGNACIYLEATVAGAIIVGNWCEDLTHGDLLYKDPSVSGLKNVVGGLISGSMNDLMNYGNVAIY